MPESNRPSQQVFFERALREAQRYGEDPWVFLRELVQNSRDANAKAIRFSTIRTADSEMLICLDDGSGMDTLDFERYLLRLYASSKESEAQAIGFFGVGFWSTLLFQPTQIRVISRKQGTSQGLLVDCQQRAVRTVEGALDHDGTEIQLLRPRSALSDEAFSTEVRERLVYYVGHVRGRRRNERLQLSFNGESLERKFDAPPIMGRRIVQGQTDGVIGFAPTPSVRIYKGGILVRDLASLGELLPNRSSALDSNWGFYPYIRLNIEGLQILMNRQSVFEDPELHQAITLAETTLLELHQALVGRLFPLPLRQRFAQNVQRHWRKWLGLTALVTISVLATFVVQSQSQQQRLSEGQSQPGSSLPQNFRPVSQGNNSSNGNIALVDEAFSNWQGSGIDDPGQSPQYRWYFTYNSHEPKLFTLRILDQYDSQRGFIPSNHRSVGAYPRVVASSAAPLRIRVGVRGGQLFALPLAPGYAVETGRVWDNRGEVLALQMNQFGQPMVFVSRGQVIEYQILPTELAPPMQRFAPVQLPPEMAAFVERITPLKTDEQIERCKAFVQTHFSYSDDPQLSRQLREGVGDWLQRSWQLGAGDCDVLNGIFVLLLRNLGIYARLEAGLVGSHGTAFSDMHAWAAIYHNLSWRYTDLSNGVQLDALAGSPAPTLPAPINASQANFDPEALPPLPSDFQLPGDSQQSVARPIAFLSPWLLLWFLLVPLAWLAFRLRRRRMPQLREGAYLRELFQHHFHFGVLGDPLQLRQRHIFPNLKGTLLSIQDLEEAAGQHGIFLASAGNVLVDQLVDEALVLRADTAVLQALQEFLPPCTQLDEVDHLLKADQSLPQLLQDLERLLQQQDPHLRIHLQPGSQHICELTLPLKPEHAALGARHLIVGEKHTLLSIYPVDSRLEAKDLFYVLRQLLRHTTFYTQEADRILGDFAERAFAVEAL